MKKEESEIRTPDKASTNVRAWMITAKPTAKAQEATVRGWLLNGPFHPAWSYWIVSAIHLREIPGTPPPTIAVPGATHELLIISLQSPPSSPDRHPNPDDLESLHYLLPPDVSRQVAGLTDDQAARICDLMVVRILAGHMSPDSDFRSAWNRAIDETAEHFAGGGHS